METGDKEMRSNPRKYSIDLKIKVVELYLNGAGSLGQLCKEYNLSCKKILREWIKKYKAGELIERQNKRWHKRTKFKNKEDEREYLKLENEYLKKKLLLQGECEDFIASLWSSKNLK